MTTHKTLEGARIDGKATSGVRCVVEIEHATEGLCYINVKAPMSILANALRSKPMPEIKRLVAEHALLTEAEVKAECEKSLRENCNCERCGLKIDGNTAYSQKENWRGMKVSAYYCESCRAVLTAIGDGEYTAMQERASAKSSYEPYTKEDF